MHYLCVTKNCDPPHENHSQTRSEVLPRPDGPHVLHRHVRADDEHRVALHRRAGRKGVERRHHHRADDLFHGQHDPDGAAALDAAGGDHDHGQPGRELRTAGHEIGRHVARADHQAADHSGEPGLRRQFLHRQQPRAERQQEAIQHALRHPAAETGPRIPGRTLLQRHRQHVDPREPPGTRHAPAARRADLRQPRRQRQHEHHRGRLGLYPPVGRQEIPAGDALPRRDLRADPQQPVVHPEQAAPPASGSRKAPCATTRSISRSR